MKSDVTCIALFRFGCTYKHNKDSDCSCGHSLINCLFREGTSWCTLRVILIEQCLA